MALNHIPIKPTFLDDVAWMKQWFQSVWRYCQRQSGVSKIVTASQSCDENFLFPVDTTGGVVNLGLPSASGCSGRPVMVKWIAGGNALHINRTGSDTIDAGTSITPASVGDSAWFISNGVSIWYQVK